MTKTVRELINMIKEGTLHTEQSTQRNMVYADIKVKDGGINDDGHEITKAGALIFSILQHNIKLPAIYFWTNPDGTYDLIDGKQRVLSLYYFLEGETLNGSEVNIYTIYEGSIVSKRELNEEVVESLYNYEIDIVVNEGSQESKEITFDRINKFAEPLNVYERFRGLMYGEFINGFEKYITDTFGGSDKIKSPSTNRGVHMFDYLCVYFDLYEDHDLKEDKAFFIILRKFKEQINGIARRDGRFTPVPEGFVTRMKYINDFLKLGFSPKVSYVVASEIQRRSWNFRNILDYFKTGFGSDDNDISKWKIETVLLAIRKLLLGTRLDYRRFFNKKEKSILYRNNGGRSAGDNIEYDFDKLEMDHIVEWRNGGRTVLSNARLLTKSQNTSRKDNEE